MQPWGPGEEGSLGLCRQRGSNLEGGAGRGKEEAPRDQRCLQPGARQAAGLRGEPWDARHSPGPSAVTPSLLTLSLSSRSVNNFLMTGPKVREIPLISVPDSTKPRGGGGGWLLLPTPLHPASAKAPLTPGLQQQGMGGPGIPSQEPQLHGLSAKEPGILSCLGSEFGHRSIDIR